MSQPAAQPQEAFLTPSELVESVIERWKACGGLEETTLLRLSILRDLTRRMHAEKSRCMAYGRKTLVSDFREWEQKIEALRSAASLDMTLEEAIERADKLRHRTRLLPEGLFTFVDREKLERYDRAWEATLAAEAAALGWCFWRLTAWVRIDSVEHWQSQLVDRLIPHGVILFAESSERPLQAGEHAPSDAWLGAWILVLKPQYRTPDFRIAQIQGGVPGPRSPEWRLLYSPKRR
jgi:hypothetical protein